MDPLTLASSFATIVSLLANYKAEHRAHGEDEFGDFISWLVENNHAELKELISMNTQAAIGIKAILHEDREVLHAKLEVIDEVITKVASSLSGFNQVALALKPDYEISQQAKSVLTQLVKSGASKFLQSDAIGRNPIFLILGGAGGKIEYEEPQFMADDLATLVQLRLLNLEYNDKGKELWVVTRAAAKLVAAWQG
jgi:hypothetical protein